MSEQITPFPDSLLKFKNAAANCQKDETSGTSGMLNSYRMPDTDGHAMQDMLNFVLPPRTWEKDGIIWKQEVSTKPASRLDVLKLGEDLDLRLEQRQAREVGICPVRRQLFTQCFDELIRQVTINCAERGLLLLRVRDELNASMMAYQTLYESAIAFGIRKSLQAECDKSDKEALVEQLEREKCELKSEMEARHVRFEQTNRRAEELRQMDQLKHNEQLEFLKKTNQLLKKQLEGIMSPKT